jgi:hypothetical protein
MLSASRQRCEIDFQANLSAHVIQGETLHGVVRNTDRDQHQLGVNGCFPRLGRSPAEICVK